MRLYLNVEQIDRVARVSGVSVQSVRAWLADPRSANPSTSAAIAQALTGLQIVPGVNKVDTTRRRTTKS